MNRIILIGNGFDLAHGLKTSYRDFIDDFWNRKCENLIQDYFPEKQTFEDDDVMVQFTQISVNFESKQKKNDETLVGFKWFESLISQLRPNRSNDNLTYKNHFLEQITKNLSLQNWVNIEYEYYRALNKCLEGKWEGVIEQLNKDFSAIQEALREYLKTQVVSNEMYSRAILEIIYSPLIESTRTVPSGEKYDNILFLNFNYTDTTKLYFQEHKTHKVIHIHGELDNLENPIIFGYGDEMDKKSGLIEDENKNEYLVNNKSIRYLQTRNYQEMLAFIEADYYEIFVMGHSSGISDRTLLNTLFEHEHCEKIKPFYYEKDGKDNYEDIVINIYRNFKDKKLCRARVKSKPNCEPLPQLKKMQKPICLAKEPI